MFNKIKDKIIARELNKLAKELRNTDWFEVKHELMKNKWEALRNQDNELYIAIEDYEKIVNVLAEVFEKGE